MSTLTYTSLINKYGPGQPAVGHDKIVLTSKLQLARPQDVTVPRAARDKFMAVAEAAAKAADRPMSAIDSLMYFNFILTTAGPNANDQFFVEDELQMADVYRSPIGEPIDWDHEQSFMAVCGDIYDSGIVQAQADRPLAIKCRGVIFEGIYPDVAFKVRVGQRRWAAVSMEALPNPAEWVGRYLVIHMPKFVGAGLVRFPANHHSKIEEVGEAVNASAGNVDFFSQALCGGVDLLTS